MAKKEAKKKKKAQSIKFPMTVLQPVKNFLQREERRLVGQLGKLSKQDPFHDQARVDDNAAEDTDAAEQVGHAQVSAFQKQVTKRLIQVRKALTWLRLGRYGSCERCGKMIDTDRLMVKPEATTCVECARKQEG